VDSAPPSANQFRPGHLPIAFGKRWQTPELLEAIPLSRDDKESSENDQDHERAQERGPAVIPEQSREEQHLKGDEEEIPVSSAFPQFLTETLPHMALCLICFCHAEQWSAFRVRLPDRTWGVGRVRHREPEHAAR
jgi:hypothetical protein